MLNDLFYHPTMPQGDLHATHNLLLAALAYIVASFSCFISLYVYKNIRHDEKRRSQWMLIGAFTLGLAIWTVHFINMEALIIPIRISYNLRIAFLSMICILASTSLAFYIT